MRKNLNNYSQKMYYDENTYLSEVRLDEDGFYRWCYTLDQYHDRKMYTLLIKIFALISLCGAVLGWVLAELPVSMSKGKPSRYQTLLLERRLLFAVVGFFVFFIFGLLIIGLVRFIEHGPAKYWYQMNERFVQIKPSGKSSGVNLFEEVKRVELYPEINEIRMLGRWGKCPVLVRREDYVLVKDHILSHVSEKAEIIVQ